MTALFVKPSPIPDADTAKRAATQLAAVKELLSDGRWWTYVRMVTQLREQYGIHATEASVSARCRDLRKVEHGGHRVDREEIEPGLHQYRLGPAGSNAPPRRLPRELMHRRIVELEQRVRELGGEP